MERGEGVTALESDGASPADQQWRYPAPKGQGGPLQLEVNRRVVLHCRFYCFFWKQKRGGLLVYRFVLFTLN